MPFKFWIVNSVDLWREVAITLSIVVCHPCHSPLSLSPTLSLPLSPVSLSVPMLTQTLFVWHYPQGYLTLNTLGEREWERERVILLIECGQVKSAAQALGVIIWAYGPLSPHSMLLKTQCIKMPGLFCCCWCCRLMMMLLLLLSLMLLFQVHCAKSQRVWCDDLPMAAVEKL